MAEIETPIEKDVADDILKERRTEYKLVLLQIMGNAQLLLEYAKMEKLTLRDAFLLLDKRIKELS